MAKQKQKSKPKFGYLLSARQGALRREVGASYPGTGASPAIEDWQQFQQVGPGPSSLGVGCPGHGSGARARLGLERVHSECPSVRVSEWNNGVRDYGGVREAINKIKRISYGSLP